MITNGVLYTPGKWKVIDEVDFDDEKHVVLAEGLGEYVVANRAGFDCAQIEHNLQLIAAAPDLLAACFGLIRAMNAPSSDGYLDSRAAAISAIIAATDGGENALL